MPAEQRGSVSECKDVNLSVSEMGKGTGQQLLGPPRG